MCYDKRLYKGWWNICRIMQKRKKDIGKQLAINYRPGTDIKEGERIKAYLEQTGQSANSYIKELIKRDLDEKKIAYPTNEE